MATKPIKHRRKARKRKRIIKFTQRARLVEKNDATRVAKRANDNLILSPTPMPKTNGSVFKVKLKRK